VLTNVDGVWECRTGPTSHHMSGAYQETNPSADETARTNRHQLVTPSEPPSTHAGPSDSIYAFPPGNGGIDGWFMH
jgi:hypothetical protein